MMRLQSEYVSVNSIPIENIHEAVELVYDRNTSMVNIVGVDYEKEIKGSDLLLRHYPVFVMQLWLIMIRM